MIQTKHEAFLAKGRVQCVCVCVCVWSIQTQKEDNQIGSLVNDSMVYRPKA